MEITFFCDFVERKKDIHKIWSTSIRVAADESVIKVTRSHWSLPGCESIPYHLTSLAHLLEI